MVHSYHYFGNGVEPIRMTESNNKIIDIITEVEINVEDCFENVKEHI
jgi:hypothetical protein